MSYEYSEDGLIQKATKTFWKIWAGPLELLSYGADVKVLEPQSFRNTVLQKLQAAIGRY